MRGPGPLPAPLCNQLDLISQTLCSLCLFYLFPPRSRVFARPCSPPKKPLPPFCQFFPGAQLFLSFFFFFTRGPDCFLRKQKWALPDFSSLRALAAPPLSSPEFQEPRGIWKPVPPVSSDDSPTLLEQIWNFRHFSVPCIVNFISRHECFFFLRIFFCT